MALVYEYILFLAKSITIVVAIGLILILVMNLKETNLSGKKKGRIHIENLSEYFSNLKDQFIEAVNQTNESLDPSIDSDKKSENSKKGFKRWWPFGKKDKTATNNDKNRLYVIDFDGDIAAHAAQGLRQEISAVLNFATKNDEVLIRLKSPGGVVNGYGFAASQLVRVREKGIRLTVAVDEVAASGGYLMACVADKIIASPFSILGSIGVIAQLPNFHKLLEKFDIDYEQFTAGKYKRTVTMFGENSDEAKEKFKEELEDIHLVFKEFVSKYRPQLDIEKIATGEHWLGIRARELDLVDDLQTSDAYIQDQLETKAILSVEYIEKKSVTSAVSRFFGKLSARLSV